MPPPSTWKPKLDWMNVIPVQQNDIRYNQIHPTSNLHYSDVRMNANEYDTMRNHILSNYYPNLEGDDKIKAYSALKFDANGEYFDPQSNITYYDVFTTKSKYIKSWFNKIPNAKEELDELLEDRHIHLVLVHNDTFHYDLNMRYNENVYIFKSVRFTKTKYMRLIEIMKMMNAYYEDVTYRSHKLTIVFDNCSFETFDFENNYITATSLDYSITVITNGNITDESLIHMLSQCRGFNSKLIIKNIGDRTSHVLDKFKDKVFEFRNLGLSRCAQICGKFEKLSKLYVHTDIFNTCRSLDFEHHLIYQLEFYGKVLLSNPKLTCEYDSNMTYDMFLKHLYVAKIPFDVYIDNKENLPNVAMLTLFDGHKSYDTRTVVEINITESVNIEHLTIVPNVIFKIKTKTLNITPNQFSKILFDVQTLIVHDSGYHDESRQDFVPSEKNQYKTIEHIRTNKKFSGHYILPGRYLHYDENENPIDPYNPPLTHTQ